MKAITEPAVTQLDLVGPERRLGSAVKGFEQIAKSFVKGARRALPFMSRQKAELVVGDVSLGSVPGDAQEAPGPRYRVTLSSIDGHTWAEVVLDTGALALILDGALGGASEGQINVASVFGKDMSAAQRALMAKVAMDLAENYGRVISSYAHLDLVDRKGEALASDFQHDLPKDALCVECRFEGLGTAGSLSLIIGAEMLEAAMKEEEEVVVVHSDPRMMSALEDVSLSVVAELGAIEIGLGRVLALHQGETLRLPTAVEEPITLRVAGVDKFDAVPVISRGQMAVEVRGRRQD